MGWYIFGGIVLIYTIIFISNSIEERKKRKLKEQQELEERQKLRSYAKSLLPQIKEANKYFLSFSNIKQGYFSNYKLSVWKTKYKSLIESLEKNRLPKKIGLLDTEVKEIELFLGIVNNSEKLRHKFNDDFLKKELKATDELLSDIDGGKSLDEFQREAIIRDEDNSLVIAGAGCGKTTTIMGKVNYLHKHLNIKPSEILLISFTKKSADDLAKKVNIEGVDAKTFHKLGLDIIKEVEKGVPSTYDQSSLNFLKSKFKELLKNEKYLGYAVKYFTDFIRIDKNEFEFENQADYIQHLKDQNFRPYKEVEVKINDKITVLREIVKSQEECKIANFLLFNGIDYKYEEPYEVYTRSLDYRQYAPDFSLFQKGKRIYLEHYGIDKNGNVPPFFANENTTLQEAKSKYNEAINWKRNLHESNNTVCLETFSYEFQDGSVFKNLKEQIEGQGFVLNPLTEQEKWELINESASDEVDSLVNLFNTFLNLYKSNNFTKEELISKIEAKSGFEKQRSLYFVALFYPLYQAYQSMLERKKQIDFSDMINKATHYIESGAYKPKYKYIIVDEFQDISTGRYKLLNAFKMQNKALKLFAVGDDFQSIYRFTGSDISLFNNFQEYFGYTQTTKIETTYRFGLPMIDISGQFVMKNPSQIEKQLNTKLDIQSDMEIFYSNSFDNDDTEAFLEAMDKIISQMKSEILESFEDESDIGIAIKKIVQRKFLILGRYNFDIDRIKIDNGKLKREGDKILYKLNDKTYLTLDFLTVHRSKGLEADYVFVLNCNSGKVGFPSEMYDDPVLLMLLGESENYPNSEERRLFYVALTRAKKKTSLIANKNFTSKFILEIEENKPESSGKCPRCKTGDLILKSGYSQKTDKKWAFYGCSNFALYNCQYTRWLSEDDIENLEVQEN